MLNFIEPCGLPQVSRNATIVAAAIYCGKGVDIISAWKRRVTFRGYRPCGFNNPHAPLEIRRKNACKCFALAHFLFIFQKTLDIYRRILCVVAVKSARDLANN